MKTGRDTIADGVAGGPARHVPVLIEEVMRFLAPGAGGTFIDGTFGAGGYTRAILQTGASVIAIDRDGEAIDTLQRLFPTRRVVGIDCTDLVWGLGAFHCVSQQWPAL